jgi:hypothetical protein
MASLQEEIEKVTASLLEVNTKLKNNIYQSREQLNVLHKRKRRLLNQYSALSLKLKMLPISTP